VAITCQQTVVQTLSPSPCQSASSNATCSNSCMSTGTVTTAFLTCALWILLEFQIFSPFIAALSQTSERFFRASMGTDICRRVCCSSRQNSQRRYRCRCEYFSPVWGSLYTLTNGQLLDMVNLYRLQYIYWWVQPQQAQFQSYTLSQTNLIAVQEQCGRQRGNRGQHWDVNWLVVYCARCAAATLNIFQSNEAFSVATFSCIVLMYFIQIYRRIFCEWDIT
jgi:hypothetical protein